MFALRATASNGFAPHRAISGLLLLKSDCQRQRF
jgi:hypothetical protein